MGEVRVGVSAHAGHNVPHLQLGAEHTSGTDTDDVLHIVEVEQLVAVNADGRHTHAGSHDGHTLAVIGAGVALYTADVIYQHRILQKMLCNVLGAKGITGHQDGIGKIACLGGNVRRRNVAHVVAPFNKNTDGTVHTIISISAKFVQCFFQVLAGSTMRRSISCATLLHSSRSDRLMEPKGASSSRSMAAR